MRLWQAGSWRCVGSLFVAAGICGLCRLPPAAADGGCVAALTDEGELLLIARSAGEWTATAPARPLTSGSAASGAGSGANAIAAIAGRLLLCAADAIDVRVLEPSGVPATDGEGAPITACGHRTPVQSLASNGSSLFASGAADGVVKLWQPLWDPPDE